MITLFTLVEAAVLASTCSIDAFSVCFAYGSSKIRLPFLSLLVINLICSSTLGLALWMGSVLRPFLPDWLTLGLCCLILAAIGLSKLLDSLIKSLIRKYHGLHKQLKFSLFNLQLILSLYADPQQADADGSRDISPQEAALLALSLSLDGLAVGFGAAVGSINGWAVFGASLLCNTISLGLGCYLGRRAAEHLNCNLSWLSGLILLGLALAKLV